MRASATGEGRNLQAPAERGAAPRVGEARSHAVQTPLSMRRYPFSRRGLLDIRLGENGTRLSDKARKPPVRVARLDRSRSTGGGFGPLPEFGLPCRTKADRS